MLRNARPSMLYTLGASLTLAMTLLAGGCGKSDDDKQAPPPTTGTDKSAKAFSLTSSETYMISDLDNLRDGCGKKPLSGKPITSVPFVLTNDGAGGVTIDLCSGGLGGVKGSIKGNQGVLRVMHPRTTRSGNSEATFDQSCTVALTVVANDSVTGTFQETQTNRSPVLQDVTGIDSTECTTSFDFKMKKQS